MKKFSPTLEQVIEARDRCAEIVAVYGERYLPIFERLENEIAARKKSEKLLCKALAIHSKAGTQFGAQIGTQLRDEFAGHSRKQLK